MPQTPAYERGHTATHHLAQDLSSDFDELAIADAAGNEVERVSVVPSEDHVPYVAALATAGWTLTSPIDAAEWTVTRSAR